MQHTPEFKRNTDAGLNKGRLDGKLKHITKDEIHADTCPSDVIWLRDGFSKKLHTTAAQEPAELKALRSKAGWRTKGSPDQIGPPTAATDRARNVSMAKRGKGDCGDWGGNVSDEKYC